MAKKASSRFLDGIFRPRSVAVIGASRNKQSIGHEVLRNLVEFEFTGPVYPVNPKAPVVRSMKCYRKLDEIPGPVDLAVIVVPRDHVLRVIEECGRNGVRGAVIITAGFKEVDADGRALEEKIGARLKHHGIRMVGPNCMGIINTEAEYRLNATFAAAVPARGNIGFVSQSGALGEAILADAVNSGLGVAMFASMGNKTDVSGNDLLRYWEHNDDIQAILMYLESFGDPRDFTRLARRVTRKKPVITVKAGRTAAGARAASSHTGSLVGLDSAAESLLEQCGVLRVSSLQEMFTQAMALANQPLPAGHRLAIVTNAGGPAILCTDSCIARGMELAELSGATRRALKRALPPEASVNNPVDMIASADARRYRAALAAVKNDPNVDAIIAIFVSPIMIDALEVARAIGDAADGSKPVLSVFMGKQRSSEGVAELQARGVPVYRFPEEASSGMSAMVRYRALRDAPQGKEIKFRVDRRQARAAVRAARGDGRAQLSPEESQKLLEAYGFPFAPSRRATTAAEAIAAAQDLGYPVVLKIDSKKISHKTDVGGVQVDLRDADEVGRAYRELTASVRKKDPDATALVQSMVSGGREVILGMTNDPQFGPLLMFGLGGVYVEVMRDIAVRIHPLTDVDAREMIRQIKGYPLLAGARGEASVDIDFLVEMLLRLSQLVADFADDLAELDINPLIVTPSGVQSLAVDARVTLTAQ